MLSSMPQCPGIQVEADKHTTHSDTEEIIIQICGARGLNKRNLKKAIKQLFNFAKNKNR